MLRVADSSNFVCNASISFNDMLSDFMLGNSLCEIIIVIVKASMFEVNGECVRFNFRLNGSSFSAKHDIYF